MNVADESHQNLEAPRTRRLDSTPLPTHCKRYARKKTRTLKTRARRATGNRR